MRVNIALVGGFLGAGKTTLVLSLATELISQGEQVAVITNDQGKELIDSRLVNNSNLLNREITGGCFCCGFDRLEQAVQQLTQQGVNWILAEAVGSCTDLVATVIRPMRKFHVHEMDLMPLTVVVDPHRVYSLLIGSSVDSSNEVRYLFTQQVKEADIVLINKADKTEQDLFRVVKAKLESINPTARFVQTSAWNRQGIDAWNCALSTETGRIGQNGLSDLDYDRYAIAESQLGWVNTSFDVSCTREFSLEDLLWKYSEYLQNRFKDERFVVAHVKVMGLSRLGIVNGSLTSTDGEWQWVGETDLFTLHGSIIVNARVQALPQALLSSVSDSLTRVCLAYGVSCRVVSQEAFSPTRPTPMYREVHQE